MADLGSLLGVSIRYKAIFIDSFRLLTRSIILLNRITLFFPFAHPKSAITNGYGFLYKNLSGFFFINYSISFWIFGIDKLIIED